MSKKKKANDENVKPESQGQYSPPPEVMNDPDLPEQFKTVRLYDEEPEPEEEPESNVGVNVEEEPSQEEGTSEQDEGEVEEEETEGTGADEETAETEEAEEGQEEKTGEEKPEEPQEEQEGEKPFITLKHRGRLINVPNTPEGIEKARLLMQQGFEFAQNMTKIKPYMNVVRFLNDNPHVYEDLVKVMTGQAEKLVSEPEAEQEDYVPPEMSDDETTEEYTERVRADMKAFYEKRAEERAREEARREAMVESVVAETRNDSMFQPTMARFEQERQNNAIPETVIRLIDTNPEAFRYFYNAQRTLAQYDILFSALRRAGILTEENVRRIASQQVSQAQQAPYAQPMQQQQMPPERQQTVTQKTQPQPEGQKPPKTETKSRRGPLHKGKTLNPKEIDWESPDQLKALDLEEIRKLADSLP